MPKIKWTLEKLQEEADKYEYFHDFNKNSWNAACAARRKGLLEEITKNLKKTKTFWTYEMLQGEALKYDSRGKFQSKNHPAYECARNRGILNQICEHMIPTKTLQSKPRPDSKKWTEENIRKEANKYAAQNEFRSKSMGAYRSAIKMGIIEQIRSHMTLKKRSWTNEEIHNAAKEFSSRKEFEKGNHKAFNLAHKRGIIDKVCKHMKFSTRVSVMERELLNIIKTCFPEAKSISDHKVFIEGKPYIKRFEIDIFVRNKMKGIEFDGAYHHSFKGLKRGRKHWTDEDIRNYHQIKDDYFLSKGIKILHIKEQDWLNNKDKCIKKCLKFLNANG